MDKTQKINDLTRQINRLTRELDQLTAVPEEPEAGAVVQYTRTLGGTKYAYAAVRVRSGRGWYTTARGDSVKTWAEIVEEADPGSLTEGVVWIFVEPPGDDTDRIACQFCGRYRDDVRYMADPYAKTHGVPVLVNLCRPCKKIRESADRAADI